MIPKADKCRTMVIIHKETQKQKINNFIRENQIIQLNKHPTDSFQKQVQQIIQKCNAIIDENQHKYLLQMTPMAPQLNALIKIHKEDKPVKPVINNIRAPSYKIAKYINKKLNQLIQLPYTYAAKNSKEVAHDLNNIKINNQQKIVTLDIKDLYTNLPVHSIINITKFWLDKNNNQGTNAKQILELIKVVINQNYF
jgi:hypothetical protein